MSEEQTQQLLYQMQMLEGYFSELSQKEASIVSIIREAASAIQSLKTIDDKADAETLVPLGLGTFVKTKTIPNEKTDSKYWCWNCCRKRQGFYYEFS